MIILSILMPTIPSRKWLFSKLQILVSMQSGDLHAIHPTLGEVQIIWDEREPYLKKGPSIGKKRESLVQRAEGKYLCFLDDDEDIAPNYVETLVRLCQQDKDVCTFRNLTKTDTYWCVVDMSLNNPENEEASPDRIVKRRPWHICPVKSEYAKLYEFKDSNYGEDWDWFSKVLAHCETEAKTNQVLHTYNHSSKVSESDKIINAGYK